MAVLGSRLAEPEEMKGRLVWVEQEWADRSSRQPTFQRNGRCFAARHPQAGNSQSIAHAGSAGQDNKDKTPNQRHQSAENNGDPGVRQAARMRIV